MAELSGLFQNLGPTTAALMNGIQAGQQYNENEAAQQLRAAQLEKTLQDTRQAEAMNPLLIQAKQQEITAASLKAKADENAYHSKLLSDAIPRLKSVPEAARGAAFLDYAQKNGIPLDQEDVAMITQLPAKDVIPHLERLHEYTVTQNEQYRREMDKQRLHNQGMLDVESARERAKAKAAKEKGAAEATLQQDLSKAKNFQGQAVVYSNHAAKARLNGDTEEATRLEALAKQATAQDLSARAAAGDAQAQNQLRLLQGFGVQMQNTPPAAPSGPRRPLSDF